MDNNTIQSQTLSVKVKRKKPTDQVVLALLGYLMISLISVCCLLPFILIIISSFTDEAEIIQNGYSFFPDRFSLEAYQVVFKVPGQILNAYTVTLLLTFIGTILGLFLTAMTSYVLQRQDFEWRNKFSFYFYFTILFHAGLVPWYILVVNQLNMKDTFLALLLPSVLNVFYIIVMKSFLRSVPDAISESAKIDGAGDFTIFLRLILPLSKPALATIGLFTAMNYWNDWYNAMLFVNDSKLYPLQYYLYRVLGNIEQVQKLMERSGYIAQDMPGESLKMALTVVATGPIILLYPLAQRFFVKGLTVGAVKG